MDNLNWEFAPTGGGDITGINDPVTTTFEGRIAWSLARESIQNIIDAQDPKSFKPAEAVFTLSEINAKELPKLDQLSQKLIACRDHYHKEKDAYDFFNAAIAKINRNLGIKVLKISDYNTLGLTGEDDDDKGNYFSFMKTVGSSSKSETQGGSFGLGKGAYYAASSFRTIFVSSVYDKDKYVFQGKSRLASFKDVNNEWTQGNGSFGLKGQKPVRDKSEAPSSFERDEPGTDIHILGFEENDWEKQMIKSVLNFFWFSILEGIVEVTIGRTTIKQDNLESLLEEYFDEELPDKDDDPNPWPYYRAYTATNHKVIPETLESLGNVKLYLLQNDSYPQKIAYIRKTGMLIQKKKASSLNGYAGVFVCVNEEGNKILRKMENPKHDEWKSVNASKSGFAEAAKKAEKELREFVSSSVRDLTTKEDTTSSRVGGLEEYLYLKGDEDLGDSAVGISGTPIDGISKHETPPEVGVTEEEKEIVPTVQKVEVVAKEITQGTTEPGDSPLLKDRDGLKKRLGGGKEGEEDKEVVVLKNMKYRSFAVKNDGGEIRHVLIIKGPQNTRFVAEIKAGTDDAFDTVNVVKAEDSEGKNYETDENFIKGLSIGESGKLKLNVTFDTNERYALNLTTYENK